MEIQAAYSDPVMPYLCWECRQTIVGEEALVIGRYVAPFGWVPLKFHRDCYHYQAQAPVEPNLSRIRLLNVLQARRVQKKRVDALGEHQHLHLR